MALAFVIGLVGICFDIEQMRDKAILWGLSWVEICFVILGVSFWIVVIRLLRRLNRFESGKPLLNVWAISFPLGGWSVSVGSTYLLDPNVLVAPEKGYAKLGVKNRGGLMVNCVGNVVGLSIMEIRDKKVSTKRMRFLSSALLWDTGQRTINIPNDGVPRMLNLAYLDQEKPNQWELALADKDKEKSYPSGWYKIDVVISSEAEYVKPVSVSVVLGLGMREYPPPPLEAHLWDDWASDIEEGIIEGGQ